MFEKIRGRVAGKINKAIDRAAAQQSRWLYQAALDALCSEMEKPDPGQGIVSEQIAKLKTDGRPVPEHIPAMIELERIARRAGGTAGAEVDETILEEMGQLSHPDLLPFLLEAFQYRRPDDAFAAQRQAHAIGITATIAIRSGDPRAVQILLEMLADPHPDVRGSALGVVHTCYQQEGCEMPAGLMERCWEMAKDKNSRSVRQAALTVLYQLNRISYNEAVKFLG